MTTLFIALKLLWRRKAANFVLLLQVLVSVAMLAQMYVFLVDHLDNVRAVGELPTENALVLPVFEYYPAGIRGGAAGGLAPCRGGRCRRYRRGHMRRYRLQRRHLRRRHRAALHPRAAKRRLAGGRSGNERRRSSGRRLSGGRAAGRRHGHGSPEHRRYRAAYGSSAC